MNDEDCRHITFVDTQLKTINEKLDKLTELTEQTHLQEYRICKLEEQMIEMHKSKKDWVSKLVTPILTALISAFMAFVIAGGLSK